MPIYLVSIGPRPGRIEKGGFFTTLPSRTPRSVRSAPASTSRQQSAPSIKDIGNQLPGYVLAGTSRIMGDSLI